MGRLVKKSRALPYILIAIFVIMSASIINAGYSYYLNYKKQYKTEIENQLSVIGKLKAEGLPKRRQNLSQEQSIYRPGRQIF